MNRSEVRYRITATLLQADGPLTLTELVAGCGIEESALVPVLRELIGAGQVLEGTLVPDRPGERVRSIQYAWAARWTHRPT